MANQKTNWKFILIVLILAILVGGGILGYLGRIKQEIPIIEFPEVEKRLEITEEDCERLAEEEKEECYITLIKKEKNPEFCKNLKDWQWEHQYLPNCSECYWATKILKFHEEKGTIPRDIAIDDKKLERHLIENLSEIPIEKCNETQCSHIVRGNFDRDPKEEIIVAIEGNLGIIKEKEKGFYITGWKVPPPLPCARLYLIKKLYSSALIRNQPNFVILEADADWGHNFGESFVEILTIGEGKKFFENEFKLVQHIVFEEYSGWGECSYKTITKLKFEDLDEDRNFEIIKDGYFSAFISVNPEDVTSDYYKMLKENCKEEKKRIYKVFKWNQEKQNFEEQIR